MVKHIILFQLKDELTESEKLVAKKEMKEGLEALVGKVPGLLEMQVQIEGLATSNADVMLYSVLESEAALKVYADHPAHMEVALGKVRPCMKTRVCLDFEC